MIALFSALLYKNYICELVYWGRKVTDYRSELFWENPQLICIKDLVGWTSKNIVL